MKGIQAIVGGSGSLGRVLHQALQKQGATVRVIDRAPPIRPPVEDKLDFVHHNLGLDAISSLTEAFRGVSTVYSAVTPDVQHATVADFQKTNHTGIQNLLTACEHAGVERVVHVSSIAVTNHLISSVNQDEEHPLPDLDSYQSMYDATKRRGEDAVLARNGPNLATCAIRFAGLLSHPGDFTSRSFFERPGQVFSVPCKRFDYMGAPDAAMALILASERLSDSASPLRGSAVFVTKSKNDTIPTVDMIAEEAARLLGWKFTLLPDAVFKLVCGSAWFKYKTKQMIQSPETLPGIPPHVYMTISQYEQTFDNSRAAKLLGFTPEESWEEVLERIVNDWKQQQAKK